MKCSYVAVMTNKNFYPGLCALKYSLARVHAKYPLAVVVPQSLDDETKSLIQSQNLEMIEMKHLSLDEKMQNGNPEQRWNETLFKTVVFNLTQFDKIVLLDLDMIVLKNIDDLFEKPHMAAVAAGYCMDKSWDRLNSGMIVIEPDAAVYQKMQACVPDAYEERIRNGLGFGDQDVINYNYKDWPRRKDLWLDETYNCMTSCMEEVCVMHGSENIRIIHFAEPRKPWQFSIRHKCYWIGRRIIKRQFKSIRALTVYLKYLRASCPEFYQYR